MSSSLVKRERSNINALIFSLEALFEEKMTFTTLYYLHFSFLKSTVTVVTCGFFSVSYWSNFHSFCLLQPKQLSLCFLISLSIPSSFIYTYFFHQAYKIFPLVLKQASLSPLSRCQIFCSQGALFLKICNRKMWKTE